MYTSTATQHLFLFEHSALCRLPPSSATLSASKSFSVLASLSPISLDNLPTTSTSFAHLSGSSPLREAADTRVPAARIKPFLSRLRALGYEEGSEDEVYVKSFKAKLRGRDFSNQGDSKFSQEKDFRRTFSGRMGERGRFKEGGERPEDNNSRFSNERGERTYQKASTSAPGDRPGFKGERRERTNELYSHNSSGRGDSQRESVGSRASNGNGKGGERGNATYRPRGRGEFRVGDRNGAQMESKRRGLGARGRGSEARGSAVGSDKQRSEGEVNGENGEELEYRHPDWKEDPKAKRKLKMKPPVAPQVHFNNPMNKQPHVAILGGGMSGLVCALTLEELGIRSTVFDTGKHGLGGRMATRDIEIREGLSLAFDHAAQYFTVSDSKFRKLVDRWIMEGAVKEWKGVIGTLEAGHFSKLADGLPRYVGTHGMRSLADHMVSQGRLIEVKRPVWISNMDVKGDLWKLNENGKPHGEYDAVVIAHNGKCANRLLAPSGAPEVFKQMKKLELSSIWALMAAFEEAVPIPEGLEGGHLDGAFVEGVNVVSWMANNSNKLTLTDKHAPHCWTFFSTAAFGKKNKVPQESIPSVKAERVRREMLRGAEIALGLPQGNLSPFFTKVQLWGAGLPTNTPGVPCIFDPVARVGICGDWLLGSSLEAAALSGMALAEHIADFRDRGELNPEEFSIGLQKGFVEVEGKDIGQFPGTVALEPKAPFQLVGSTH